MGQSPAGRESKHDAKACIASWVSILCVLIVFYIHVGLMSNPLSQAFQSVRKFFPLAKICPPKKKQKTNKPCIEHICELASIKNNSSSDCLRGKNARKNMDQKH